MFRFVRDQIDNKNWWGTQLKTFEYMRDQIKIYDYEGPN